MKKKFYPNDWLNTGKGGDGNGDVPGNGSTSTPTNDTELIIARIEAAQTDITTNYTDWLNICFALADEFGEAGRAYFKRISQFYPGYSVTDSDKQYDQCMKAKGHGITIKTLFHLAKQAGVEIGRGENEKTGSLKDEKRGKWEGEIRKKWLVSVGRSQPFNHLTI